MSDHIGEATKKVIDLDALEKLADEATASGGGWECSTEAGSAFIEATDPATIKALIAELKEAHSVIERLGASEAFDMPQAISGPLAGEIRARMDYARAFLARNGKGEEQ